MDLGLVLPDRQPGRADIVQFVQVGGEANGGSAHTEYS